MNLGFFYELLKLMRKIRWGLYKIRHLVRLIILAVVVVTAVTVIIPKIKERKQGTAKDNGIQNELQVVNDAVSGIRDGASALPEKIDGIKESAEEILTDIKDSLPANDKAGPLPASELPQADEGTLQVHFVNVGQGDAILLIQGTHSMLIDTGEYEMLETLKTYISERGVTHLDTVIATHPHSDHIGSMAQIIKAFTPDVLYLPDAVYDSVSFDKMIEYIDRYGVDMKIAEAGMTFTLGDADVSVIAPVPGTADENLNNNCVVSRLTYGNRKFLFAADAEEIEEGSILATGCDISADVLKVSHHGSFSASTKGFLEKAHPEYAVICVGEGNENDHPHDAALDRLKNIGAEVFRTDRNGNTICVTDGNGLQWYLEKIQ